MKKIHITLLGKETLPAYYPIRMLQPDCVYIIGTDQNKEKAECLKRVVESDGHECFFYETYAYDVSRTTEIIEHLYDCFGVDDEVTCNITGGTKMMAIAAYNVAMAHHSEIVYTESKKLIHVKDQTEEQFDFTLSGELIFELQGQQLKSWKPKLERDEKTLADSMEIEEFVHDHQRVYRLLQAYKQEMDNNGQPFPSQKEFRRYDGVIEYKCDASLLKVKSDYLTVLEIENDPLANELLLDGRWWEEIVADALFQWSNGRYKIWQSVEFNPNQARNNRNPRWVKNEVDTLVKVGNTFVFVECKSGNFTQDNIYKLDAVKKTYGSGMSKAILISFYSPKPDLYVKAAECGIKIITLDYENRWQFKDMLANELDGIVSTISLI